MQTETIITEDLKKENIFYKKKILPNAINEILIEELTLKGVKKIKQKALINKYDVLFVIKGESLAIVRDEQRIMEAGMIIRMPFNEQYTIQPKGNGVQFLRFRKLLDKTDINTISKSKEEHSEIFIRSFEDCPVYTEDIKSSKSINRMILPEGKVPRFCMGSVETDGPDSVAPHEHPMLDQLFFGLKGCRCTCTADGESQLLTENMLLHIPLGSKHSVSVSDGDKLAYIWFDFFLTIEGQKYMGEQHRLEDE